MIEQSASATDQETLIEIYESLDPTRKSYDQGMLHVVKHVEYERHLVEKIMSSMKPESPWLMDAMPLVFEHLGWMPDLDKRLGFATSLSRQLEGNRLAEKLLAQYCIKETSNMPTKNRLIHLRWEGMAAFPGSIFRQDMTHSFLSVAEDLATVKERIYAFIDAESLAEGNEEQKRVVSDEFSRYATDLTANQDKLGVLVYMAHAANVGSVLRNRSVWDMSWHKHDLCKNYISYRGCTR